MSGSAPQPSAAIDQLFQTVFTVVNMAVSAMRLVPGVPGSVITIASTAVTDVEAAYAAYVANPSGTVFDQIDMIINKALADVKAVLHP